MSWYGEYVGGVLHEQRAAELQREARRDAAAREALRRCRPTRTSRVPRVFSALLPGIAGGAGWRQCQGTLT